MAGPVSPQASSAPAGATVPGHHSEPAGDDGGFFIGLMSGTSVDGIDAALVEFTPTPRLVHASTLPLSESLRALVLRVSQADARISLDELGQLDSALGQAFADAANTVLKAGGCQPSAVRAIGSHGQTLRHRPFGDQPFTMQVGDANVIAEKTGITTVADFRRRDVAAGGQGAPLVPAFHAAVLADPLEERAVLNLGGIANLTLLPTQGLVRGFDTGPGNGLMDAWCLRHRQERFDRDGAFAGSGQCDDRLLARLLAEPWLALAPPKSTGRDQFHLPWLEARLAGQDLAPESVQATLARFTARTVADALLAQMPGCGRLIVCGGGVHNPLLMADLRASLPGISIESSAAHRLDPDFVEAMAFAWLARETLAHRPGNLAAVTGARGPRVLGCIYPGGGAAAPG